MKKISMVLAVWVLAAMILAACGGGATSTAVSNTQIPSATVGVTETSAPSATEVPTEGTSTATTETPGIPVTGPVNADRLSNELKFKVLDQSGKQVGKVEDMVLDLSKAKILYVIVGAAKKIAVPWAFLKVGPASASSYPNEQQNTFILQTDTDTFNNAPEFNLKNVPQLGEAPDSWDIAFRKYWAGGGASSGNNTPSPAGTAATDMTATATTTSSSAGTGNATSTPATGASASQGSATSQGATSIQGVQLASQVLGATVMVGTSNAGLGTSAPSASGTAVPNTTPTAGTGSATSTPSTGTSSTTSTPSTAMAQATSTTSAGTSSTTSTPGTGANANSLSATISDMIVNNDSGEIMYIVIKTSFDDGEHLIPVPLGLLELISTGPASDTTGASNQSFVLNIDPATLQNAPFFKNGEFPDLTMPGWNSEFDSFWQNNGSGQGTGAQATATP